MKYVITLVLIILFFSGQILSQEKNKNIPSPYKTLIEKLNNIHNFRSENRDEHNKKEFLKDDSKNNKLIKKLENLENEFYSKVGFNDNNSRTTRTETLLADGFLEVESISQNWDGINWVNNSKNTNIYDVRNNKVQATYQNWNVAVWENSYRYSYTYDVNNNQTGYTYQTWDGANWVNYLRYLNTYDANNNRTEQIYQSWDGSTWVNGSHYSSTFDANNNLTQQIYQTWNGTVWVDNSRYTNTFDSNNNQVEQIYQTWSGMVWVNGSRYTDTYDANNNVMEDISQTWDGSTWVNVYRTAYSYDASDNRIEILYQTWDVSVWKNDTKYSYAYDANNNPIEYLYQTWDNVNTVWVNNFKYSITYDANQNMIELLAQTWNVSVWENSGRYTIVYDSNNNPTEEVIQSWDGTTWVNSYKYSYTYAPATSIVLTSPNGGENWPVGTSRNITWTSSNVASIKIQYSTNNGTNWLNIANVTASSGSYAWTIPNTTSTTCKVMISDVSNALLFDESDTIFTISPAVTPTITVSSPNGGENWNVGTTQSITWTSNSVSNVKIEYSTNNGTLWTNIVSSTPASAQSYSWTIPNTASTNCKVQISDVSNATINDQSNSVFTISVPVTPVVTVTSPNGGESWPVGAARNITWISSNVTNVKIDYSTNNGTNWTNIVASTTASAGSYNWVVPNTASTNCKVQISDASDGSIYDQSNAVFTIFTYPSSITMNTSYNFGDPTKTTSYQIIGLPGANNLPITNIVTGSPGVNGDWRAFWDAGSGAYTEYSSGSTFNFTPGKAFWVVSKNQININQSVFAVTLAADNTYSIPIHNGWNLISNPFDKVISWSNIQAVNSVTQPIHFYQTGSYTNPANFEQYKGYYFFNNDSLKTNLKIPYSTTNVLPKQKFVNLKELEIILTANAEQKAILSAGVSEDAKLGLDNLDIFSPPSGFCEVSMSLYNNEMETNYKYLQKDYRPKIGEGQEFNFSIKNVSDQTLDMVLSGMDNFMNYEMFLLDKNYAKLYDLKQQNSFEVKTNTVEKQYSLLIGTKEFIRQKKLDLMPTEFSLFQNYPNPFNPTTRIMFSLPQQSNVSLKIYNILGELAAEIISNQIYDAGYHEVIFDGSQLASGIYLYKLQTSSSGKQNFEEIKKMMLIK